MPRQAPPPKYDGTPATVELTAGTTLSRVHRTVYDAAAFNPVPSAVLFGGGRFDSTDHDRYGYLYAALSDDAAVAETLLRDRDADDRGWRFLSKRYWAGRQLSRVSITKPIRMVSIRSGRDLGAIGQDTWLTTCGPDEYPQTRAWAHWLRETCPDIAGIVWLSKREPAVEAVVLFEDRCPAGLLVESAGPLSGPCAFDEDPGFHWLQWMLAQYRVAIRRR